VFLFYLQIETTNSGKKKVTASTIPVRIPKGSLSIVAVQFVQDVQLVLATSQSTIHIYSLEKHENGYRTIPTQTFPPSNAVAQRNAWLMPIHSIICSVDGVWIASTRNSYDQSDGVVDIYRTASDGYQFWWSLPTLDAAVTAVSFMEPQANPMITVACVNFAWYIFDLVKRSLSDWSVQAGYPLAANKIPNDLAARNDYPIRISANPANPSTLLIVRKALLPFFIASYREEYIAKRSLLSRLACHPRNSNNYTPISPFPTSYSRFERYRIGTHFKFTF
jgi:WD40 repeat protein